MRAVLSAFLPLAVLALAVGSAPASASRLAVAPDGDVLFGAEVSPGFAGVARLTPSGRLDPSFGDGGVAIDRQLPSVAAIGLQPDGGVVLAASRQHIGPYIGRLRPDGTVDSTFNGTGTVDNPFEGQGIAATAVLTGLAGERVGVASYAYKSKYLPWPEKAWVEGFSATGVAAGSLGALPDDTGYLEDVAVLADGSLVGAVNGGEGAILRKLIPAAPGYDEEFGGGEGRAEFPGDPVRALTADGAGFLAAGSSARKPSHGFAVARYDGAGVLDSSFGQEGVATVPLGSALPLPYGTNGVAVAPDGKVVVVGSAIPPAANGFGPLCYECAYPVVGRLLPDGTPDPSFGAGGVVALDGVAAAPLPGDGVAVLPGGGVMIASDTRLVRLSADGSLDPSFGDGGVFSLEPCGGEAEPVGAGCALRAHVRLRVSGLRSSRPSLSLRVQRSRVGARIGSVKLVLPRGLRLHPRFAAKKQRVVGHFPGWSGHVPKTIRPHSVSFHHFDADQLRAEIGRGAFSAPHRLPRHRRLSFRVVVSLHAPEHEAATTQTVVVRHRVGGR